MRRSPLSAWKDIPVGKSLFTCGEGRGIPIGDLISQLVANFLLNDRTIGYTMLFIIMEGM